MMSYVERDCLTQNPYTLLHFSLLARKQDFLWTIRIKEFGFLVNCLVLTAMHFVSLDDKADYLFIFYS